MLLRIAGLCLLIACSFVQAEYELSHEEIVYPEHADEGVLVWVKNTGAGVLRLQARTRFWTQETQDSGADLAVYPYWLEIQPGEQEAIRLMLKNPKFALAPLFFRLELSEFDWHGKPKGKVIKSLPVYHVDLEEPVEAYAMRNKTPQGERLISIHNPGRALAKITRFKHSADGWIRVNRVVLPGNTHAFDVTGLPGPYKVDIEGLPLISIPGPAQLEW